MILKILYSRWNLSAQVKLYLTFFSLQLIEKLEEKCSLLPSSHKKALSAESDEIMYTTTGDVGIYYDDNGQHQVFWDIIYLLRYFKAVCLFVNKIPWKSAMSVSY